MSKDEISKGYEERIIEFEAAKNEAMEAYFEARPQLWRTGEKESIFTGGFRMAWELKENKK